MILDYAVILIFKERRWTAEGRSDVRSCHVNIGGVDMIALKILFMYVTNYPMVFLGRQGVQVISLGKWFYVRTKIPNDLSYVKI